MRTLPPSIREGITNSMSSSSTARPRVSIGMPVYNGARYFRAAIESLLSQTLTDFELIISDNASTDATETIVREFAARDERIVYIRQLKNQGASWNFNCVVERARAEYFKWAASDDVCAPTFLARCVEVLDQRPEVVLCHSRTQKIDANGDLLSHLDDPTDGGLPTAWFTSGPTRRHRPDGSSADPARRLADVLLYSGWSCRSYAVIRTEVLRQTSLIEPYYGSEKVTFAELALRGRFCDVPEPLFFQRVHEQMSSRLATGVGQQQYIVGQAKPPRKSPRLQLLRAFSRAISRAPLSWSQRLRCRVWLFRYVLQLHKWPDLLRAAIRGRGVQGAGSPRVDPGTIKTVAATPPPPEVSHVDG